ncbi:HRDC domain-containing protein [Bacillus horti]|uniref:Superfamily II DNA helicase RecQ n=1 Tax=Caldalkalibacillus horti TaxID=77523 RepID=A0ABT9W4F6_9BACI|nr:HRDC domain-containing protein [Bacillus horti]MDQ0168005.1 superfamily II DNA helicase RecQ [Bacillus horti]
MKKSKIFDTLKLLRKELALENGVPAYMICGDQVLRSIVTQKPEDAEQLIMVNGIGEKFVEKYGDEFLNALNESVEIDNERQEENVG